MENIEKDQTVKFFVIISVVLGAMNGLISLIQFIEEKQIAQKKLMESEKNQSNKV